ELVPDLQFIANGVGREQVWLAGAEVTLAENVAAGVLHLPGSGVDVGGIMQPEAEMNDATGLSGLRLSLLEHEHVPAAGRLRLDEPVAAVHFDDAEHLRIAADRPLRAA